MVLVPVLILFDDVTWPFHGREWWKFGYCQTGCGDRRPLEENAEGTRELFFQSRKSVVKIWYSARGRVRGELERNSSRETWAGESHSDVAADTGVASLINQRVHSHCDSTLMKQGVLGFWTLGRMS
jgi:hypothetical protein